MCIQMSGTRVKTVKRIHSGYKHTYYIITLTAKFWKVNEDLLLLIAMHYKKVIEVIAALRMLLLYVQPLI